MAQYALVIGVGQYEDPEITDLDFASADAEELAGCLEEVCGFDEIKLLTEGTGQPPTNSRIVDALTNLAPELTPQDTFLFYFAGHGIHRNGRSYLLTPNSRLRMPELASLPLDVLRDRLQNFECRDRVLVLDACRNDPRKGRGEGSQTLSRGLSRDIMTAAEASPSDISPTTCLLFSCSEGQRAFEWPDKGHGAFTYYLLEGIRKQGGDELTVQSVAEYVEQKVPRWAQKTDQPHIQRPWSEQVGSLRRIHLLKGAAQENKPETGVAHAASAGSAVLSGKGEQVQDTGGLVAAAESLGFVPLVIIAVIIIFGCVYLVLGLPDWYWVLLMIILGLFARISDVIRSNKE